MSEQKIKKTLFEVHKPSSQISSIYELNKKQINLTPFQFDTMNFICFKAREQILKKYKMRDIIENYTTNDALFDFLRIQQIDINLNELSDFTNKYKGKNNSNIMNIIRELEDIKIKVGLFKQDDLMIENRFNLISRTKRITNSKTITVWLEPEMILGWIFGAKPFKKLYLKIQTLLKYTYSKILYENCKDYENIGKIEKPFKSWIYLFNVKSENVSRLKYNYLNKSIKEINKHTDIFIDKIYGTKKDGKVSMTVEFHKQQCSMIDLLDQEEELSIEDQILMNKAELIYENLPKFRKDKINDKEQYIKSIFKKDYDKLKDELALDDWINVMINDIEIKSNQPQTLSILIGNNVYAINDNYNIQDLDTNEIITKNATETIAFINDIINKDHSIELLEIGNKHEFSKSSINLI